MSDIRRPTSYVTPSLRPFIEMLLGEDLLGITLIDQALETNTEKASKREAHEGENSEKMTKWGSLPQRMALDSHHKKSA